MPPTWRSTGSGPAGSSSTPSRTLSRKAKRPERVYTDVVLTIQPKYAILIAQREKNHEFRSYQRRADVKRLWLYESAPTCAITCVVETSAPKTPGQLRDSAGVGNDAFNAHEKTSYAYPIRSLYIVSPLITRNVCGCGTGCFLLWVFATLVGNSLKSIRWRAWCVCSDGLEFAAGHCCVTVVDRTL
ncbi:uncharacterized protein LAESUDRAFT_718892 [Laetiporus sulphureus 93-53]|uniref:Uncharacterized protein n=1 Tax=Laetiporus sulphureus 93-53 TaxID=1314785 RepID=A0A165I5E8_9APHY|nr:uncharacterized protein LAESUDRAFT_718892 [Laetiporus sulphureus 93-53]KZT12612.1 hypothetical protein LAESUDRAFT_718892 [Laetiporus sulphureus 93-53]